nr:flavanone 7-O-glucoside 2''-O-beta-L-rhamnosyltransferase-like [Coffea arabica]
MYNVSNGLTNKERYFQCIEKSSNFVLVKTLSEIEQKHIDYYSLKIKKEVIPVGPLVQEPENRSSDMVFLEWLSKRGPSSVIFFSFGTEYFLSKEEIEVIAYGLELSMVSFIWVVRFHGRKNVTSLPEGFQKRVAERGMVVEGWAPQVKILGHPNIGGFASHCGWSSTLIAFDVPIIAMPMQLDQPLNSRLVAELGVGIEVRRENGKFREEIASVIKQVVVQEEGKKVRKKG